MKDLADFPAASSLPPPVLSGQDRLGQQRGLGVSRIDYKVIAQDTPHLFILENIFHQKGGPARHKHFDQDEWFHVLEGEFIFEIGPARWRLKPGDSLLGPRGIPHVWAFDGAGVGRILIAFTPAGKMEAFFNEVTRANAMPAPDPALWRAHGMELLGPPLPVG
jgi:quercetin dioxygenase-like cupin family protein